MESEEESIYGEIIGDVGGEEEWGKAESGVGLKGSRLLIHAAILMTMDRGRDVVLDISDHGNTLASWIRLGEDVEACQQNGTKVLVSLGGPFGTYSLKSVDDAEAVANQLLDSYLYQGGFDGIDFRIESGSALYYENLAKQLKDGAKRKNREIILSAFPGCVYPDNYLARAINANHLDIIWIQYFNNSAYQYDSSFETPDDLLLISWKEWNSLVDEKTKLFLGIPASATIPGYIPPQKLLDIVIPNITVGTTDSKYAGVSVWNRYYDLEINYSRSIYGKV
ncbi:endochitinase Ziz m 1.0101-like [Ziziphus jujuba]|uniref:Endochitinase Ziz m 1.0101-like n=1 Tax=Ziziphus jujuba TaxID=326968 RepID=A0ABM4AB01_ZIZJJ|nr:endochitinase Ziz m 1.0101-like [Ziziphus jujuba]